MIFFLKTADNLLYTIRLTPALLSSNIVNRSLWEKTDNSIYMGTFWVQFATLLSLLPGHSSYCISKPYVLYRYNNLRWYKHGEESLKNTISLMKIINGLKSNYSGKSVRRTIEVMFSSLPREIFVSRISGVGFKPYIVKFIKEFKEFPFFWFFIFPLMFLPSNLCALVYELKRTLVHNK